MRSQRGQTAAEYLGVLVVIAAIIGALATSGIGDRVSAGVSAAICKIAQKGCENGDSRGDSTAGNLTRREQKLADLAAAGKGYRDLLDQARAARERGDYGEADRILKQLELYDRLRKNDRGDLIDRVNGSSDPDFQKLVNQGTIPTDGNGNQRFFTVPPSPGDGVVVMDYFIPTATTGGFLKGDDRGTVDPLTGNAGLDKSRIVVVLDRESGRGVIYQSQTCTVTKYCERPLPVELGSLKTAPQGRIPVVVPNPLRRVGDVPLGGNEFDIKAGDGYIDLNYDALNSITPVGLSVDGNVRLERNRDGDYKVVRDTRDRYPRIVTGQYRPGGKSGIIDETKDEDVLPGAVPRPVRDAYNECKRVNRMCSLLP